jgi:hypothetical protein
MSFGAGFLRFPDLFPGRASGEAWGDRAVVLDVAGGPYLVAGLAAAQAEAARRRFGALCRPAPAADTGDRAPVSLKSFRAPAEDFLAIDTRGWEYALDLAPAAGSLRVAGMRLMARLDGVGPDGEGLAGGVWTCEAGGEEWASVFENCFRVAVAYRLLGAGGAVLHSAGVAGDAGGFLLLGPSGAGKTTASRLCLAAGATVLSDDLNAVRFAGPEAGGGARLLRLPFTGDLGDRAAAPGSVPLRAVLRLVQGPAEGLRPLSPAAALGRLLAAAPFVNRDPWRREALLGALERLARAVPAYELTFSPRTDLWSILRSVPP